MKGKEKWEWGLLVLGAEKFKELEGNFGVLMEEAWKVIDG